MSIFSKVGGAHPRRNKFNLSYSVKTTADMGILYPAGMPQMMVPGDSFKIGHEIVAQLQPMVSPAMADISIYFYDFFVPFRILWDQWETFITRGESGDETPAIPKLHNVSGDIMTCYGTGSLWDYFGFPPCTKVNDVINTSMIPSNNERPLSFLWKAYDMIWNEYFRDENLQEPIEWYNDFEAPHGMPLRVCWGRDYFTSSLPFQQRGTPVAIPVVSSGVSTHFGDYESFTQLGDETFGFVRGGSSDNELNLKGNLGRQTTAFIDNKFSSYFSINDIASADVADLRFMFQVQKFMERSARAGVRYTEFLRANFGVSPRDERLQRPEFIGGTRTPILIQQVLQTSQTDGQTTPTGTKYGQGMTADSQYSGKYYATEYGVYMPLFVIRPKTSYQQGINRQWLKDTSWDFFNPLFQNLSEQEIYNEEIFSVHDPNTNRGIFGFTGRYNELRHNQNIVTGRMRDIFDYWHLGRKFDSLPTLNSDFVTCNPSKRIFAVQDEDAFILHIGHRIKALRPMVYMAEPGLIDHH